MSSAYGRYSSRAVPSNSMPRESNLKPIFNAAASTVRRENTRWQVEVTRAVATLPPPWPSQPVGRTFPIHRLGPA